MMSKTLEKQYGLIPHEIAKTMSGLKFFQRTAAGEFPHPPICETLDFHLAEVENGRVVFSGEPKINYYNPFGTIHGGYISTLLDSAMSCAVQTTVEAGRAQTTLELKVSFVRPILESTGKLFAEGEVISVGKQIATAEGKLTDERGKLYAHSTTTCLIFTI